MGRAEGMDHKPVPIDPRNALIRQVERAKAMGFDVSVGTELTGRISGVQRFGAFVRLDETGADGLLPIREIGREYFHYDRDAQILVGSETGMEIGIGQRVVVRLTEAVPVTGGLMLELLELDGAALPRGPAKSRRGSPRRKLVRSKKKSAKTKRKLSRKR